MKTIAVIPSRLSSTRLPGKPLLDIDGLPMIVHVLKRTLLCKDLDEVYVATCDDEISEVVSKYGGNVIITSKSHNTGTDRIAEAVKDIECDIIVNVQGDEPLVYPDHISSAISLLMKSPETQVTCLACTTNQVKDPNEVKLVLNSKNEIMYFSRSDIPSTLRVSHNSLLKQYCIYVFRKKFLIEFSKMQQTPLEKIEYVELLRALENGYKIKCAVVKDFIQSVDTKEELTFVRELMKKDKLRKKY